MERHQELGPRGVPLDLLPESGNVDAGGNGLANKDKLVALVKAAAARL